MHRHFTKFAVAAAISALGVVGIAGAASALPIRDVTGLPPNVVIVDPPPPTTVPPVTVPPATVPPTTVATPPTTDATGDTGSSVGTDNAQGDGGTVAASQTSLPPLGIDTLAATPAASETHRSASVLILVGAVLAATLAGLGAGLFLRHQRRPA